MASKEVPGNREGQYSNDKGYTPEQIDKFNTERYVTMFLAIVRDGAKIDPQSGKPLFSELIEDARTEQKMREDPELANAVERFLAIVREPSTPIHERQPQSPPEPETLFDRIHRGRHVYISKEGKTRTTRIVFPS